MVRQHGRLFWVFQAAAADDGGEWPQEGQEYPWAVKTFREELHKGDEVAIWQPGPNARLLGFAKTVSGVERKRFRDAQFSIRYKLTRLCNPPVTREVLRRDPVLGGVHPFRPARGGIFKLASNQWRQLSRVQGRRYWVVSPNVKNNEATVSEWRAASVKGRAVFMGYGPKDKGHHASGYKFAHVVRSGHVILIARRHANNPEIVGFGVVRGNSQTSLKGVHLPSRPGSVRRLVPFVPLSRVPDGMPVAAALKHTKALAELYPTKNSTHKKLCDWLERKLKRGHSWQESAKRLPHAFSPKSKSPRGVRISPPPDPPGSFQEDYTVQTRHQVKKAKKKEAMLVAEYRRWLERQDRTLSTVLYKTLRCDGYEQARRNLIEAKSSASREHLRMAVGQLVDYAYQGQKKLGEPNKAVLVPKKPSQDLITWLRSLAIAVIWREKKVFLDTANGQFT